MPLGEREQLWKFDSLVLTLKAFEWFKLFLDLAEQ